MSLKNVSLWSAAAEGRQAGGLYGGLCKAYQ